MLLSEGQMSDKKRAALMIDAFPKAKALLADRGYDADWFRHALAERGIAACIPSKTNRKVPIPHDTASPQVSSANPANANEKPERLRITDPENWLQKLATNAPLTWP